MNCKRVRRSLTASGPKAAPVRRHLAACESCSRFAQRLAAVERSLSEHHTSVVAPTDFAQRLSARLPQSDDLIGWAALRVLPATLALVAVLSWLNLRQAGDGAIESLDPTEAVLSWVLETAPEDGGTS